MGVLEKITANMELTELKKFNLQKAILALMLEWKHLEEYMDSTQHSFQECLDQLQLKEKYLNSVQESAVESNKEMESIRVSIERKIKELDDKEREFLVFRDEQINAMDLKEKQLGLIGKSIEERIKLVELREKKLAAKQKFVEGVFKKFKVEEKRFEDIRKSVEERNEEINSKGMQLEKRCKELESKEKELGDRAREIESMGMVKPDNARAQKRNDKARAQTRNVSRSAQSALLGEPYVDALVRGEVEVPLTVSVAAGKGAEKVAEAYDSRSKRAASSGVLAARKRRRTLHFIDEEEANDVQVTRVVAVNEGGQNSLAQQGEANAEDLPGGWSPKVDPQIDDKLATAFNVCFPPCLQSLPLKSLACSMSKLAIEVWSIAQSKAEVKLSQELAACKAEEANKLKAEQLAWEAERSKLQEEIDKANKLLTKLTKAKSDLERSLATMPNLRGRLDEKKYLSRLEDCEGKLAKAEAEVKLSQELAACKAEEANKLKAEQLAWETERSKLQGEINKANKLLTKQTKAKSDLERSLAARPNLRGRLDEKKYLSQLEDCEGKLAKAEAKVKLSQELAACKAEEANKLKAEQLAWEAERSKLQGEIDKANKLLTKLTKAKSDLERSLAAMPNLRGRLDEKKYLSRLDDCEGKLAKAEAEVKLSQELAACKAEEANKLKAEQLAWEAERSKHQGEIDKANKLLTKQTKAKNDLERSLAARPNLRGRLDEKKYLSQLEDCEGKLAKAEAEVKLGQELAVCKAEEANKLKAKQIAWEAERSKLKGEIDKANKLLTKLTKAKTDLERSLTARPNLRGRLSIKMRSS